ncbi:helix-turn-helix domain-containing protein [Pusillimonas sp. TS35]|uniref:IclR family transcriptional regulator n=1 Tax=Paracandidimonas lactea TaxID=2895524 RepID=UPI00136F5EA8|nr:IclR family transcriptional regulator [Paracandidimonas lactea]MYN12749.1 helix-turn-helix domain-containing protein [Pusillimonas sp. TS35]
MIKRAEHQVINAEESERRSERKFVTALARGLQILESFHADRELGNHDIAQRTGLPHTTVTRLTYTLTELGYLRRAGHHGKYVAGAGFLGLSASINRNLGVQRVARPYMERLSSKLDCSVILGMRDRLSMVFLEVVRPQRSQLVVNTDIGSRVPITTTAIGLAYLVGAPLADRTRLLAQLQAESNEDWAEARGRIERAYANYDRRRFVLHEKSWSREVSAVATPLVHGGDGNVYSFMCGGPSSAMTRARLINEVGPCLVTAVNEIRAALARTSIPKLPADTHVAYGRQ